MFPMMTSYSTSNSKCVVLNNMSVLRDLFAGLYMSVGLTAHLQWDSLQAISDVILSCCFIPFIATGLSLRK